MQEIKNIMLSNFHLSYPTIKTNLVSHSDTRHTLTIDPLLPGFGHTLGNSLRRIFLSSIPGFAVTKIRINDVTHEYQTIPGIVEDVMDIVLNLKSLRFSLDAGEEKGTLLLTKNGAGEVFASDFQKNAKVKIINSDTYICSLDKNGKLEIEIEVTQGFGYYSMDQIDQSDTSSPQDILVDALFSPVTNIALEVTQVRFNDKTNFEKIEMNIETDGTVAIKEIIDYGLKLSVDLFGNIHSSFVSAQSVETVLPAPVKDVADLSTEQVFNFSKKVNGILEKNGILSNEDLIAKKDELAEMSGLSEKGLKEIQDYIKTIS